MAQVNTHVATASVPSAAAAGGSVPAHDIIAGQDWHRALVHWGVAGRKRKDGPPKEAEMLGVFTKKDSRGRLKQDDRANRTVDVWELTAVYALFNGTQLEYVGEGALGAELDKYRQDSTKVWDRFTWFAPATYGLDNTTGKARVDTNASFSAGNAKNFVEFLEVVLIHCGKPRANSQRPEMEDRILWLEQAPSERLPLSTAEQIAEIHAWMKAAQGDAKK